MLFIFGRRSHGWQGKTVLRRVLELILLELNCPEAPRAGTLRHARGHQNTHLTHVGINGDGMTQVMGVCKSIHLGKF
jgi:hypothetical protein